MVNWVKGALQFNKKTDTTQPLDKMADEVSDVQYYGFRLVHPDAVIEICINIRGNRLFKESIRKIKGN